jgi:hypothetical protein
VGEIMRKCSTCKIFGLKDYQTNGICMRDSFFDRPQPIVDTHGYCGEYKSNEKIENCSICKYGERAFPDEHGSH